ncbi:DUF3572 domain-containing protein [Hyphomicrobium sp. D-2]|uniref:DUF3572 domain-containing protein n=1 Tax=Hyphomicrobium sp. D-2 TaxID=3041621 RepID=UPI0024544C74|nr:DUF3572 domain-containing protein [Hyphomicrobium sp. D-2]MDH4982729.1 DUF3572 domain-containing protein [Hyphomicrobium sp. D-2]
MHTERANSIGESALLFLASDPQRISGFLTLTGVGPAELRENAHAPEMLAAVLDYLLQDESLLLVFCASETIPPGEIAPARRALAKMAGETGDPEISV